MAFSTSSEITCSPNAERKCLILPETMILYGSFDVNLTVSPMLYAHSPADVEMINK